MAPPTTRLLLLSFVILYICLPKDSNIGDTYIGIGSFDLKTLKTTQKMQVLLI